MAPMRMFWLILLLLCTCFEGYAESQEARGSVLALTIDRTITLALQHNRSLLTTADLLVQAKYGVDGAMSEFSLSITPNGEAGYGGGDNERGRGTFGGGVEFGKKWTTGTLLTVAPSIVKSGRHYYSEIETTLTQPLLRGLGKEAQLSGVMAAQFAFRSACRELFAAKVQLALRAVSFLYTIEKLKQFVELDNEAKERMERFYHAVTIKEKMGMADALDLYRAELEVRLATDRLEANKERLEESKDALRELLALPMNSAIDVDVPISYTPHPVDLDKTVALAIQNRVEIDEAKDAMKESARLSRGAKKNLMPEVNLVLNYANVGRTRRFIKEWNKQRDNVWGVGLTTSTDIYSLTDQIAYQESLLAAASSQRDLQDTEAMIVIEVKKAIRSLERSSNRLQIEEKQRQTAEKELRLATLKFNHGLTDNFHVIQSEKSLFAAKQNYQEALIDHIVGEFQLLAAMGLLLERPKETCY